MAAMLVLATGLLALSAIGAPAATTRAQKFFSGQLQSSSRVDPEVRKNLKAELWRVDRDIVFADLTGDEKSDAIVRVNSGTAAQDVAVYVLSSRGGARLRVVFAAEGLYRVTVSTRGNLLRLTVPSFKPGEPTCRPSSYVERAYAWRDNRFTLRNRRAIPAEVPEPEAEPSTS